MEFAINVLVWYSSKDLFKKKVGVGKCKDSFEPIMTTKKKLERLYINSSVSFSLPNCTVETVAQWEKQPLSSFFLLRSLHKIY